MDDSAIIQEFLTESHENLDQLERNLVALEEQPGDQELLSAIFRTMHTIKGTCGFLGFQKLQRVSHVAENLLSKLRDGVLGLTPDITSALLATVDAVREILGRIASTGGEGEDDYAELIATLGELQSLSRNDEPLDARRLSSRTDGEEGPASGHDAGLLCSTDTGVPSPDTNGMAQPPASVGPGSCQTGGPLSPPNSRVEGSGLSGPASQGPVTRGNEVKTREVSDHSIRVDIGLLDRLMNQVGELVLARNQILQYSNQLRDSTFTATSQRLNLITTELQEGIMKTRMQPIGNIWSKFPRLVRDLAMQCGKKVEMDVEGQETELDKKIIEAIKDPLTHLVRNAIDHGIEEPQERAAVGKPPIGRLRLRAFHEGGQVTIEISDDGRGLDLAQIRQKAVERGLISADHAMRLTDREASQLIFFPGFSTATKVTNVSGRGVGMDVVKTNVERIGGIVDVQSEVGQGTTVTLKIPLTLAIIPALIVTCQTDRYAIPHVNLLELVRLSGDQASCGIEYIHRAPVYRLRGRLLPLVSLRRELGLEATDQPGWGPQEVVNIVVLHADGRQFGLIVDAINDTEEIVVKPLGKQLKGISVYAGATIMGDGGVALILDVLGLAQRAHVVSETGAKRLNLSDAQVDGRYRTRQTALLVSACQRRFALPLGNVARLEHISLDKVEQTRHGPVVQYGQQVLPLRPLHQLLGMPSDEASCDTFQVVVCRAAGELVGLVVDEILDIAEFEESAPSLGTSQTTVVDSRVTEILQIENLVTNRVWNG